MQFVFFTSLEMFAAAMVLLPIFGMLNHFLFQNTRRTFFYFLFSLYLAGVYIVVGLPNVTYLRLDLNINIIPFRDMLAGLSATVLNVVLFIPLGIFLSLFWENFRSLKNTILFGFLTSFCIELLQIFTFRATDINDLITNTFGTLLGWELGRLALSHFPISGGIHARQEIAAIFGAAFLVMFFLHPFLMNLIWNCLL